MEASWHEIYGALFSAVQERFAFLADDHGFDRGVLEVSGFSAEMRFRHPDGAEVQVKSERGGTPWAVVVVGGQPPSFGMFELIALVSPTDQHPNVGEVERSLTEEERNEALDRDARFLRDHANVVLRPDETLRAALVEARSERMASSRA